MLQPAVTSKSEEQVKIIDFDIATVKDSYDEKTKTTFFIAGSFNYAAPEQLNQKPGRASDIYALGVIAYEMLTGRLPFPIPEMTPPETNMYFVFCVLIFVRGTIYVIKTTEDSQLGKFLRAGYENRTRFSTLGRWHTTGVLHSLEPPSRIELLTCALRMRRSTN